MIAAIWVLAVCHAILTACGVAEVLFRFADEKRFRCAQEGLESGFKLIGKSKLSYSVASGRRKRAKAWIETVKEDFEAKEMRKEESEKT